jgi:hypothetical protein
MACLPGHIPVNAQPTRRDSSPDQKRFRVERRQHAGCLSAVSRAGGARSGVGLSALNQQRDLRPVLPKPLCGIRLADDTLDRSPGGVLERLVPEPCSRIVDEPMKALVAGPRFKSIGDPDAGPALLGKMQDALRIGLAKPWCRVELESECIIGSVARSPDYRLPPGSALRSAILTHAPARIEPNALASSIALIAVHHQV